MTKFKNFCVTGIWGFTGKKTLGLTGTGSRQLKPAPVPEVPMSALAIRGMGELFGN